MIIMTARINEEAVRLMLSFGVLVSFNGDNGGYLNLTPGWRRKLKGLQDTYAMGGKYHHVEKVEEFNEMRVDEVKVNTAKTQNKYKWNNMKGSEI